MVANVIQFPKPQVREKASTIRLPLYTDYEIETVLLCVNIYSTDDVKHTFSTLSAQDPVLVMKHLNSALESNIFTEEFKKIIRTILENAENVEVM